MARQRSPNSIKAEEMYIESSGKLELVEIAKQLNVSDGTVRSWKNRYKWDEKLKGELNATLQKENKKKRNVANKKDSRGAPKGNKNAMGNSGGSPPLRNKNAETHGFFSKYLPEETLEIMKEIETRSPIDLLWEDIKIQQSAIIRSQRIMYVRDKSDQTRVQKKVKGVMIDNTFHPTEEELEYQHAWDKQATFLQAQSRAMAQLTSMIKRYEEMCKSDMVTEEQRLRIEKLKVDMDVAKERLEIEKNKVNNDLGNSNEQIIFVEDLED